MMSRSTIVMFAGLVLLLSSCSSAGSGAGTTGDDAFPSDPLETATTDDGALHVAIRTSPSQPPPRGTCAVELTIPDATGAPRDGLVLDVVPWMPAHGHGASAKPAITARGGGKYVLSDVNFFMPGDWELRTTVSGPLTDHVAPTISIP